MIEDKLKVSNYKIIRGKITTMTGLLIGGPEGPLKIGGVDKEPINLDGRPYIPGSSLKGKMRAVLTYKYGENEEIKNLFGTSEQREGYIASRVIVRDCFLSEEWKNKSSTELYEIKMENAIDKTKGTTKQGALRTFKRVKPGVSFDFEIVIIELSDNKLSLKRAEELVKEAFELIQEKSYLGGNGSRGYGKIKIEIKSG